MNAISNYTSYISGYIPEAVKDAAGLSPQISEDVRHITWMGVDNVFWTTGTHRLFLVLGYVDGFQVWDVQDPNSAREVLSKQDKAVIHARLMPVPLRSRDSETPGSTLELGAASAPLLAYVQKSQPTLVRFYSMQSNDVIYLLRLTQPAVTLQGSRRVFAVGMIGQVDLYDALRFESLFSVQIYPSPFPAFALGQRWIAYNLPPQTAGAHGTGSLANHLPTMVRDGLSYLQQGVQRTLDHILMPPEEGAPNAAGQAQPRSGVIAVRDVVTTRVTAQFEDHLEPIEMMRWDPSGLVLVSSTANGHCVLVHKALAGSERAALLILHDSVEGGLSPVALGSVVFQHLYTLSRGYTPAVISDIAISDDMQFIAVSSAKGTTHVFSLPPLHSPVPGQSGNAHHLSDTPGAALASSPPRYSAESGKGKPETGEPVYINAATRVKLGSMLLQEGLMPKCAFPSGAASQSMRPLCVATRAGMLSFFSMNSSSACLPAKAPQIAASSAGQRGAPGENSEGAVQVGLTKVMRAYRTHKHFTEKLFSVAESNNPATKSAPSVRPPQGGNEGLHGDDSEAFRSPNRHAHSPRDSALGGEQSKWLSQVETATHVLSEVPLWFWPQLSFYVYPDRGSSSAVNQVLRAGGTFPDRRPLRFRRLERPGDGVRYNAGGAGRSPQDISLSSSPLAEEHLSQLVSGAVSEPMGAPPPPASFTGAAWGTVDEQHVQAQNRHQQRRGQQGVRVGAAWCVTDQASRDEDMDNQIEDDWLKA